MKKRIFLVLFFVSLSNLFAMETNTETVALEIDHETPAKIYEYLLQHLDRSADIYDKYFATLARSFMRLIIRASEKGHKSLCFDICAGKTFKHQEFDGRFFQYYSTRCNINAKQVYVAHFKSCLRRCYVECGMLDVHGVTVPKQSDQDLINAYFDTLKVLENIYDLKIS